MKVVNEQNDSQPFCFPRTKPDFHNTFSSRARFLTTERTASSLLYAGCFIKIQGGTQNYYKEEKGDPPVRLKPSPT